MKLNGEEEKVPIPGARVFLLRIEPDSLEAPPWDSLRVQVPLGRGSWSFGIKLNVIESLLLRLAYRR